MSRSRRTPYFTDGQKSRGSTSKRSNKAQEKRMAARAVRATSDDETPAQGSHYRKEYCSWSICDWKFYSPKDPKAYRK